QRDGTQARDRADRGGPAAVRAPRDAGGLHRRGHAPRHMRRPPRGGGAGRGEPLMAVTQPVRAGVVGTGHMGQYHVLVYAELPGVELVGVADIDADRARAIASRYETQAFGDHRELIGKVDVASVAVPTEQHFHVARDLLEAGVSVL